jgi:hypothetical protein
MPIETEIKFRVDDLAGFAQRLEAGGFTLETPRAFESNVLYDTARRSCASAAMPAAGPSRTSVCPALTRPAIWIGNGTSIASKPRPRSPTAQHSKKSSFRWA